MHHITLQSKLPASWTRRLLAVVKEIALVIALAVLAVGCRNFQPVDIHTPDGLTVLEPGDTVRVETTMAESRELKLSRVDHASIEGEGVRYKRSEILSVERDEADGPVTAIAQVGTFMAAMVVAALGAAGAILYVYN
jgi:hypothetical protein